jgi:hypothetical protein
LQGHGGRGKSWPEEGQQGTGRKAQEGARELMETVTNRSACASLRPAADAFFQEHRAKVMADDERIN